MRTNHCGFIAFLGVAILAHVPSALASTGELYGYGSRASALGNTMMGGADDGFATFYNPAANSANPGLQVSLGVTYAHPKFLAINNVTTSNSATSSATGDQPGNVDTTSYLDTLEQELGASFNFGEKLKNLTVGLTGVLPLARVAYLDSGEPFAPEYFQYRSRTQRPQIYGSLSATPFEHVHVGTGIAIATNLSASVTAFVGASGAASSQRFASTIKPSMAPYFSVYVDPKPIQAGAAVRLPNSYKVSIDTTAHAQLLGPTNDIPLILNSASTLFYDPLEIDAAGAYRFPTGDWVTLEADWYHYKAFEAPTLGVVDKGSLPKLDTSVTTLPAMRDILVPRIGVEHPFELVTVRAGYSYRLSPVRDNSGAGNLVDPTQHVFTAGAGLNLRKAKITQKDIVLDAHIQYHWLVHQHIDKSAGNENGSAGQTKVGAPGYDIGGSVYGGGVSLSMSF